MSEHTHGKSELFGDTNASDGVTVPAEDTNTDPKLPESNLGQRSRDHQIKIWADKLESGETTADAMPENLEWLKELALEEVSNRSKAKDIDARVEAKLAERERVAAKKSSENKFEEQKAQLSQLDLTDSDKALLDATYKRLMTRGLSRADALEEAISTFDTLSKAGQYALDQQKKRMNIPLVSKAVETEGPGIDSEDFHKKGDATSRVAAYEAEIRSKGAFR